MSSEEYQKHIYIQEQLLYFFFLKSFQRVVEGSVSDTYILDTVDNESACIIISDAAAKIGLTFYEPCQKNVLNSQNIYLLLHFLLNETCRIL